jgi:hypothetical protein
MKTIIFKIGQKVAKKANKQGTEYFIGYILKSNKIKSLVRFDRGSTNWVNNSSIEIVISK